MDTNRLNKALEDTFDDTMIDYESLPHVQYERDQIERQIRELTLHHPEAADDITDIKYNLKPDSPQAEMPISRGKSGFSSTLFTDLGL